MRRRELAALRAAPDAREALVRAMAFAPPPDDTDFGDDVRRTVTSLLAVTLRAGHTPPAGSAALLREETRRALVDDLDDNTVRTLTHALLAAPDGDLAASWLRELLPRYGRSFDPAEALARTPTEYRADVYNAPESRREPGAFLHTLKGLDYLSPPPTLSCPGIGADRRPTHRRPPHALVERGPTVVRPPRCPTK